MPRSEKATTSSLAVTGFDPDDVAGLKSQGGTSYEGYWSQGNKNGKGIYIDKNGKREREVLNIDCAVDRKCRGMIICLDVQGEMLLMFVGKKK